MTQQAVLQSFGTYDRNSYRTLPPRKPPTLYNEAEDVQRSVTPDITRGLQRSPSKIPMGISNFFSPIHKTQMKDSPKSPKISPIDPRNTGGFQSSTPTSKTELSAAENLTSKLNQKKSTMSYDELYAVIHKTKKKFNVGDEVDGKSGGRHSWSPNEKDSNQISDNISRSRQSWALPNDRRIPVAKTSTMDFKRLLLSKTSPNSTKMSAVEQLKLSKAKQSSINILDLSSSPKNLGRKQISPNGSPIKQQPDKTRVVPKLMLSPRSAWRFANPRTDVLSSTILEDCREDESPNNSLEKSKNSENVVENDNKSSIEHNIKPSSVRRQISTETACTGQSQTECGGKAESPTSPTLGLTGISRAQYLQAQKAQFLMMNNNNNKVENQEKDGGDKCPSPPALETAL